MLEFLMMIGAIPPRGSQIAFTTPGTYDWIVPEGVMSISAVAVGAGGGGWNRAINSVGVWGSSGAGGSLRYRTAISVTPGETLKVVVGLAGTSVGSGPIIDGGFSQIKRGEVVLLQGNGGRSGGPTGSGTVTNTLAGGIGDGGGNGGNNLYYWEYSGGGAGAGGYSGNGGDGGGSRQPGTNGSGGAGGGGFGAGTTGLPVGPGGRGGGVGILGAGANGTGAMFTGNTNGLGGSQYENSGEYGGGGSMSSNNFVSIPAQSGAVRIVWGIGRSYPNFVPDML